MVDSGFETLIFSVSRYVFELLNSSQNLSSINIFGKLVVMRISSLCFDAEGYFWCDKVRGLGLRLPI